MIGGRIFDDTVLVGLLRAAPAVQPLALTSFCTKPGDTPLTEVNRSQMPVCDSSKLPASARLANILIYR